MIAVDANGADQGPAAVAEGVRRSGVPVLLFGPVAELRDAAGPHAEIVDAPESIKAGEEAVAAVRSRRDASIVQAAQAVGEGRAEALVPAGSRARRSPRPRSRSSACAASSGRRSRCCCPCPAGPCCCSTRARASRCARSTSCSSPTWGRASWRRSWACSSPPSGCSPWVRRPGRARRACSPRTSGSPRRSLNFVGNLEGFDLPAGRGRRGGGRWLHRQRGA